MERLKRFWYAFRDIATIFSFVVNFVLVVALLVVSVPGIEAAFALKTGMVEPLLNDLDAAFLGLSESTIDTKVDIDDSIPIKFDLPLNESLDIDFPLPINQDTVVVLTERVPLNLDATFNLPGGGGVINGSVQLSLPYGTRLPIRLNMVVPVTSTIPVRLTVPVSQTIPVRMNVPVHIELGEAGLDPAVQNLRAVFEPVRVQVEKLPDGIEFGEE
jgi:hypothetical protein